MLLISVSEMRDREIGILANVPAPAPLFRIFFLLYNNLAFWVQLLHCHRVEGLNVGRRMAVSLLASLSIAAPSPCLVTQTMNMSRLICVLRENKSHLCSRQPHDKTCIFRLNNPLALMFIQISLHVTLKMQSLQCSVPSVNFFMPKDRANKSHAL